MADLSVWLDRDSDASSPKWILSDGEHTLSVHEDKESAVVAMRAAVAAVQLRLRHRRMAALDDLGVDYAAWVACGVDKDSICDWLEAGVDQPGVARALLDEGLRPNQVAAAFDALGLGRDYWVSRSVGDLISAVRDALEQWAKLPTADAVAHGDDKIEKMLRLVQGWPGYLRRWGA